MSQEALLGRPKHQIFVVFSALLLTMKMKKPKAFGENL